MNGLKVNKKMNKLISGLILKKNKIKMMNGVIIVK